MIFPAGPDSKESACNAGDRGLIPELGRCPGEGNGNPLQFSCLENPPGLCQEGYSPWGRKELDMTEPPTDTFSLIAHTLFSPKDYAHSTTRVLTHYFTAVSAFLPALFLSLNIPRPFWLLVHTCQLKNQDRWSNGREVSSCLFKLLVFLCCEATWSF